MTTLAKAEELIDKADSYKTILNETTTKVTDEVKEKVDEATAKVESKVNELSEEVTEQINDFIKDEIVDRITEATPQVAIAIETVGLAMRLKTLWKSPMNAN